MLLEGSCHCGAVRFRVKARYPVPFMHCYCSVCRKTAGGGGYAINLGADFRTLEVKGREHIAIYRAKIQNPEDLAPRQSPAERSFCRECGSALWLWHPRWPDLVHPVASAIDTPLPRPRERTHMMLEFKPEWVEPNARPEDQSFSRYPKESLAKWHERTGAVSDED